jgi:hypothetical protein
VTNLRIYGILGTPDRDGERRPDDAEGKVMNDNHGELRWVERNVIRMVVLDAGNHVLLLQTRDLGNPAFGTSWELPGGGMEPRGNIHRRRIKGIARGNWHQSRASLRWQTDLAEGCRVHLSRRATFAARTRDHSPPL